MSDRPISHLRSTNAADALLAARREFWNDGIRPSHDSAPNLYAARILQSDDLYGRVDGLIVHGDEVAWRSVDALFDLAIYGAQLHARLTHPDQHRRNDCEWCDRIEDFWHVALVDEITRRRGTTADLLDADTRAQVAELLPAEPAIGAAGEA
ncbi:MAG: hypothetical protein ACJ74U_20520 [Jatrophihabitantaceae bacterium]